MLCDNCGKHEASIKLTQIINGKKTEMMICEECGQKMGIADIGFEMPIDISNFLGDFELENENFMPFNLGEQQVKCQKCDMTYDEFLENGKFGCEDCYKAFGNKIDNVLKRIQGTDSYIGRTAEYHENNEKKEVKTNNKLKELQNKLKQAIKDERYEEAAKIRDEIKGLDNENKED